jgi:hypothetical protein
MQPGSGAADGAARHAPATHAVDGRLATPRPSVDVGRNAAAEGESVVKSRAEGLSFYYGPVQALKNLNIEIRESTSRPPVWTPAAAKPCGRSWDA